MTLVVEDNNLSNLKKFQAKIASLVYSFIYFVSKVRSKEYLFNCYLIIMVQNDYSKCFRGKSVFSGQDMNKIGY